MVSRNDNLNAGGNDDLALIERLRAGDDAAFLTLMNRYGASLFRVAMLYVHDIAAAEDVVQETWPGVVKGIDRFEGRSSLKTWLFTILTNRAKRRGERDKRTMTFSAATPIGAAEDDVENDRFFTRSPGCGFLELTTDRLAGTPRGLLHRVGNDIGDRAGNHIAPPQREVITPRDVEGWPSDEVRNVLNLSETNQ